MYNAHMSYRGAGRRSRRRRRVYWRRRRRKVYWRRRRREEGEEGEGTGGRGGGGGGFINCL